MDKKEYVKVGINVLKISGGAVATKVVANVINQAVKGGLKSVKTMNLLDITKP